MILWHTPQVCRIGWSYHRRPSANNVYTWSSRIWTSELLSF